MLKDLRVSGVARAYPLPEISAVGLQLNYLDNYLSRRLTFEGMTAPVRQKRCPTSLA